MVFGVNYVWGHIKSVGAACATYEGEIQSSERGGFGDKHQIIANDEVCLPWCTMLHHERSTAKLPVETGSILLSAVFLGYASWMIFKDQLVRRVHDGLGEMTLPTFSGFCALHVPTSALSMKLPVIVLNVWETKSTAFDRN